MAGGSGLDVERLHDLPDFLSHCQGLLRCRNGPCELEESQSRFDLGDADASLSDNLPHRPLSFVVLGLVVFIGLLLFGVF